MPRYEEGTVLARILRVVMAGWALGALAACASEGSGAAVSVSGGPACTLTVSGQTYRFDHVFAIRAPDPYDTDDSTRLTRVLCLEEDVANTNFASEEVFIDFAMQLETPMATVDVRDNGEIVAAGYATDNGPVIGNGPFGGYSQLEFAGSNGPERITGTVATKTPLPNPDDADVTFTVTMEIDRKVDATW